MKNIYCRCEAKTHPWASFFIVSSLIIYTKNITVIRDHRQLITTIVLYDQNQNWRGKNQSKKLRISQQSLLSTQYKFVYIYIIDVGVIRNYVLYTDI